MDWPTPQDYNEAIQNPDASLGDAQLHSGEAEADKLGLPRPVSGAFASVYHVQCQDSEWAVRCFLQPIQDQQQRYGALSDFIDNDDLDCTVPFNFQLLGIRVRDAWYPIIKMAWVNGVNLNAYVDHNLASSSRMARLAEQFKTMCFELDRAGIAHGDLQHGNIMVLEDGTLRLVDYDGMFVPELRGLQSNELGHRNYQHPRRSRHHFGSYLDNFSAWVIYTSLRALAVQPSLWAQLHGGDECLLLRQADFQEPLASPAFARLEHHPDHEIAYLTKCIRHFLTLPMEQVPGLDATVEFPSIMPVIPTVEEAEKRRAKHDEQRIAVAAAHDWAENTRGGGTATKVRSQTKLRTSTQTSGAPSPQSTPTISKGWQISGTAKLTAGTGHQTPAPGGHASGSGGSQTLYHASKLLLFFYFMMFLFFVIPACRFMFNAHSGYFAPGSSAWYTLSLQCEQAMESERYNDMLSLSNQLISANQKSWKGFWFRSFAERQLGQFDNAIADGLKAIELNPSAETYFNYGAAIVRKAAGNPNSVDKETLKTAIDDINQLIRGKQGALAVTRGYYYRGLANQLLGEQQSALADFDRITNLQIPSTTNSLEAYAPGPTLADVYFRRGLAHAALSKYDKAAADFSASLERGYGQVAQYDLTIAYYRGGKLHKALDSIDKFIKVSQTLKQPDKELLVSGYKLRAKIEKALHLEKAATADLHKADELQPTKQRPHESASTQPK